MKQATKINLLVFVAIVFMLVLGLFALARFFGKQLIQPCMKEGFTDSEIDAYLTKLKDPTNKKMDMERVMENKLCDMLVHIYTKPGLVSRIVIKGNNWLHLRQIQINGPNKLYIMGEDYTMDITGSPKFYLNNAAYDFSKMVDKFDSMFHSGTGDNVVFTITMKTPSAIASIIIKNRFDCCWERIHSFTMYGYNAAGTELFSKKLDDPALSNFRKGSPNNYDANRDKNMAAYVISPFGYVRLLVDNVCFNKLPIMDVRTADYKRIYLTQHQNITIMMSESGEIAVYPGSISNFTEDRWKNARKITIPVGYSVIPTIFPTAVLPSAPTTAPPTTTPVRTSAPTTPAVTTTPVPTKAATTAATTARPSVIPTVTPTIAATTAVTTEVTTKPISVSQLDAKPIGETSSNYSTAYGSITYNI